MWVGRIEAGFDADGKRRRVTVTASTESRCKEKLESKKTEIARSGIPDKITGKQVRVKDWADEWLEIIVNDLRPAAYASTASAVRKWITPTIGSKRLTALAPTDIRAVATAQRQAGRTNATRARTHSVLMQMLKAASLEGHSIRENVLLVPKPRISETDREAISPTDCALILEAAMSAEPSRWIAALMQGLRQGEALGLRWEAIDFEDDLIDVSWQLQSLPYIDNKNKHLGHRLPDAYVTHHLDAAMHLVRPKSARSRRVIPLERHLRAALLDWREKAKPNAHDLVWPDSQGRPRSAKADRAAWVELQKAAGVLHPSGRRYVLHEARHSTATLLLNAGVERELVELILGHSKLVEAYDHSNRLQDARVGLSKISDLLGITTPLPGPLEVEQ